MTITDPAAKVTGDHRIDVVPTIHAVDPEAWNRVVADAGGSIFHTWHWLAAFEDFPPGDFEARHLLAYDGDDLVAICPAYLVNSCPRLTYLADLADLSLPGPVLMAHSLAALEGGPLAAAGHESARISLLAGLEASAHDSGAWAWAVANAPAGPLTGQLMRDGYATAHITTSYQCATDVPGVEDYWAFSTSRYRRKLGQERRGTEREFTLTEQRPDTDTLVRLVHSLLQDRNTPTDVLPDGFLHALHTRLAPFERTITAVDADQQTVAVFAGWQFEATWSSWLAGLDTSRLSKFTPYRTMAVRLIDSAVNSPVTTVDLGRANAAQKRRLGARPVPLYLALKAAHRRDAAALHAACRRLEERCQGSDEQLDMARRCC
ncbi:GNAT family N-acetyltransferase [Streptomyces sp. LN785]|uniref:GNAT family N-acetyltransferase n=1 Tax=Streptomyces sp. LN785 TaxID=3112983 RepID=UPI0037107BB4